MRLDRSTTLSGGQRLRLRMPHASDRRGLAALLGQPADDLAIRRLVSFDPRVRLALCATVWDSGGETIVGYAAIDVHAEVPDILAVDECAAPGVRTVLEGTLLAHAAHRRHVA